MLNTFLAALPIFLLIVSGYICKNCFVPEQLFWNTADKLVYYVFFPCLLLLNISHANFNHAHTAMAITATVGATIVLAALIIGVQCMVKVRDELFTSIFQGGIRYNSYLFIALSQSLFGAEGVALSGVFIAHMILLSNILSVLVMNHYGNGGKKSFKGTLLALAQNPLIIAALLGLSLNISGITLSGTFEQFLHYLGNVATPLSLMSVGGGLLLNMHASRMIATAYAASIKLLIMPVCTIILLKIQGASGIAANIALLYAAVPCAGNAYILSRQMGGDSEAMASIITWTTLLSIVTITLILGGIAF